MTERVLSLLSLLSRLMLLARGKQRKMLSVSLFRWVDLDQARDHNCKNINLVKTAPSNYLETIKQTFRKTICSNLMKYKNCVVNLNCMITHQAGH